MARLRAADFDERLTLVEHLDELRGRIIVCVVALVGAIALCFWQNNLLLELANRPLPDGQVPITFGVTEPFMTTLVVASSAGVLLALPVLLYQAYAFVIPAFSAQERRVVIPLLLMVPLLFIAGVLFAYFVIMPVAVKFLLSFNSAEFEIQVRARDYYSFLSFSLMAVGILFQIPVAILAFSRLGVVTPEQLAANRRYAVLIIAVVAMLLPGPDPVTMILAMLPLLVLFELSILLARRFGRPPESELGVAEPAAGESA